MNYRNKMSRRRPFGQTLYPMFTGTNVGGKHMPIVLLICRLRAVNNEMDIQSLMISRGKKKQVTYPNTLGGLCVEET